MRYMISGYGAGSRTRNGTDESRSFRTMRGDLDTSKDGVDFLAAGVRYKDRAVPCMRVRGKTKKTGRFADDNEATLILHDLSPQDAVDLATRLIEYAGYLREREGIASRLAVREGAGKTPPIPQAVSPSPQLKAVSEALLALNEVSAVTDLVEAFERRMRKSSTSYDSCVESFSMFPPDGKLDSSENQEGLRYLRSTADRLRRWAEAARVFLRSLTPTEKSDGEGVRLRVVE